MADRFLRVQDLGDDEFGLDIIRDSQRVAQGVSLPTLKFYLIEVNPGGKPVLHEVREKPGSRTRQAIIEEYEIEANGQVLGSGRQEI